MQDDENLSGPFSVRRVMLLAGVSLFGALAAFRLLWELTALGVGW